MFVVCLGYSDALYLESNKLTGDVDGVFCPQGNTSSALGDFSADCGLPNPEVACSCCTICCNDQTGCVTN
jgi:hypothetical protein